MLGKRILPLVLALVWTTGTASGQPPTNAPVMSVDPNITGNSTNFNITDVNTTAPTPAPSISMAPSLSFQPTAQPTMAPTFIIPECYTDLTLLDEHMKAKRPFEVTTHILCPNTVFPIGFPNSDGSCCNEGQRNLMVRGNTIIKCGEDGSSKNNCVIKGGQFQLLVTASAYDFEDKEGIVIQGITFTGAGTAAALLVSPGITTMIDCVFKNNEYTGAINMVFFVNLGNRRRNLQAIAGEELEDTEEEEERVLSEDEEAYDIMKYYAKVLEDPKAMEEHRKFEQRMLQRDRNEFLSGRVRAVFDSCEFTFNTYSSLKEAQQAIYWGIHASTQSNDLEIRNCIFKQNEYGDKTKVRQSYAVRIAAGETGRSTVKLSDNCFVNNNYRGVGVVVIQEEESLLESKGNYGTYDADVDCQFISFGDDEKTNKCSQYESATCLSDPSLTVPTAAPQSSGPSLQQSSWSLLLGMIFAAFYLF